MKRGILIALFVALSFGLIASETNAAGLGAPVVRLKLHGFSMYPTIKSGEYIVCKQTSVSNLNVGDIVVFKDQKTGTRVCHRVVGLEGDKVKTKGDNNRFRDRGYISDVNLLGLVTHIGGRRAT